MQNSLLYQLHCCTDHLLFLSNRLFYNQNLLNSFDILALPLSPDYLLQDELSENEISKIHEIEMLWKDAPLSKQELALAMIKAALKHPEQ